MFTTSIQLPKNVTTVDVKAEYDHDNLEDNTTIRAADKAPSTGDVIGKGSIEIKNATLSNHSIGISVVPKDPNDRAPKGFDPSKDSKWSLTVKYSMGNNDPVYSSENTRSTRPNSSSGSFRRQ